MLERLFSFKGLLTWHTTLTEKTEIAEFLSLKFRRTHKQIRQHVRTRTRCPDGVDVVDLVLLFLKNIDYCVENATRAA
jgi:hypothetical protein